MDKQIQEERLRSRLQEHAKRDVPDNLIIWPAIYEQIQQSSDQVHVQPSAREHSTSRENLHDPRHVTHQALPGNVLQRRQPAINLGLAALVAIILTAGVAAVTLWLLPQREDLPISAQGNLDSAYPQVSLPIQQSINGYTVSLYPWYAADNHIVITYTVADPQGNNVPLFRSYQDAMHVYYQDDPMGSRGAPKLSDDLGRVAHWMESRFAWSNPSRPEEVAPVSDIESHRDKAACCLSRADVMWIDFVPPTFGEPPSVRNLHLELPVFLPSAVLTPPAELKSDVAPVPTLTKLDYGDVVDARLIFDFPLQSDPERQVVQLNQTVEAAGATITLEKVVVAPRDTFVALHYGDAPDGRPWSPKSMELAAGEWTSGVVSRKDGIFFVPPTDQQGAWVLTIHELYKLDTSTKPFEETTLNGPWVFEFTVPPAPSTVP